MLPFDPDPFRAVNASPAPQNTMKKSGLQPKNSIDIKLLKRSLDRSELLKAKELPDEMKFSQNSNFFGQETRKSITTSVN